MKVLQVNCVYKKGSTGKIVYDVHTELQKQNIESVVCYGRGEKINEPNVYKTCGEVYSKLNNLLSRITGIMYGGCFFSTNKLIKIIKNEKPDIVHLHCINGYFVNIYRLLKWLGRHNIKTVTTLHAEFMHTGGCGHAIDCNQWRTHTGCGHAGCPRWRSETKSLFFDRTHTMWRKMKKAFESFNENLIITSVSPWLMERAEQSIILGDKEHRVVINGLDEQIFKPRINEEISEQIHKNGKKAVLFVTPSFSLDKGHIKGGYYVVELAKRMPDVNFIIIGCQEKYDSLPKNVMNIGRVDNQIKLAEYYTAADVTVLPSCKETFSMVTAESLCCGTPVAGFLSGGPESIAVAEYSRFVDYGDTEQLLDAVKECFNIKADSAVCIEKYKKENMCRDYIAVYNELVK